MDGLRNFVKVDDDSALEVGHLTEGTRSFQVRRPKFEEGYPEVSMRQGPEELTPRAEEVGSQKACINVDHIAEDTWDRLWQTLIGMPSCQAIYKGIEGSDWEKLHDYYKEMSRAAGVKKPNESQKVKALWPFGR